MEADLRTCWGAADFALRMDVQVGKVVGAQDHQMRVRAEIWLEVGHRDAVVGRGETKFAARCAQIARHADLVAVRRCRP